MEIFMVKNLGVPAGFPCWALFGSKSSGLIATFQSRESAEKAADTLGREGYEVRFGAIEKSTGNFIPDEWRKRFSR
jgi:hypothetical protein